MPEEMPADASLQLSFCAACATGLGVRCETLYNPKEKRKYYKNLLK